MSSDCIPGVAVFLSLTIGFALSQNNTEGCTQPSCARCTTKGCVKCSTLIVYPTRRCVDECPFGHVQKRSTFVDFSGTICQPNGLFLGLSNNTLAVFAGLVAGLLISALLLAAAAAYAKRKRAAGGAPPPSDAGSEPDDKAFVERLEALRPHAPAYLQMLNDTRRQMRELRLTGGGGAGATGAYRPVVRDLAKVLLLLNRPVDRAPAPDDWEHLLGWAEKALRRYRRMSETSLLQVAQLVDFLQPAMGTFKPEAAAAEAGLRDLAVRAIDGTYESGVRVALNPQWRFECSPTVEFDPTSWSKEVLNNTMLLDDDFWQLGFRPQDEITTEL